MYFYITVVVKKRNTSVLTNYTCLYCTSKENNPIVLNVKNLKKKTEII